MLIEGVQTDPDPYKPYLLSQATRAGHLLFVSGQAGYDDGGQIVEGGFRAQADQAFSNLDRALTAGGGSLAQVVKVTIFVTDMSNFSEVVESRRRYFAPPYPADSIVEVAGLYTPEAEIEIEAIAVTGGSPDDQSASPIRSARPGA